MIDLSVIPFLAVSLVRLVVPLFIPRFPLPAILAAMAVDAIDQPIVGRWAELHAASYQTHDKALDVYYLAIAYASTIRNWGDGPAFRVGRALWYYRLVGVVLFEYTEARWLLFVFPNAFELYFIAIELLKLTRNPFKLTARQLVGMAAFIWIFIKLPQEWWLHIARLDVTDFVEQHLFGVPGTASWREAVEHRSIVLVPALLVGLGLFALARVAHRLLPSRDWDLTWSADAQRRHLGWPAPRKGTAPSASFGWAFFEKVVLATLVTVVFVRILPGADTSIAVVAVGATAVIAVTTLISQWLVRHGIAWRSGIVRFAVVLAANSALVFAASLLLPEGGARPPLVTSLFLIGLLSLMVALLDHCRWIGRGHPGPELTRRAHPKAGIHPAA